MLVSDLMTKKVRTIGETDNIASAQAMLQEFFIRHIPVVDPEGSLVGLVTQRDILATTHKMDPTLPVRDIMRTGVATTTPTQSLRGAAETMIYNKYGCLPVLEDGRLVGIITETDFLKLAIFPLGPKKPAKD